MVLETETENGDLSGTNPPKEEMPAETEKDSQAGAGEATAVAGDAVDTADCGPSKDVPADPVWVVAYFTDGRSFKVPYERVKLLVKAAWRKRHMRVRRDPLSYLYVMEEAQQLLTWREVAEFSIQFQSDAFVDPEQEWKQCRIVAFAGGR